MSAGVFRFEIFLYIFSFLNFAVNIVLGCFEINGHFGYKSIKNISDRYEIFIIPPSHAFISVWTIIYIFQFVWFIAIFVSVFCRNKGNPIFPLILDLNSWLCHFLYSIHSISAWVWIVLFTKSYIYGSLAAIAISALFSFFWIAVLLYQASFYDFEMSTCHRIAIHFILNGLSIVSTWLSIAFILHLGIILVYIHGIMTNLEFSIMGLSLFAGLIVGFYLIDIMAAIPYTKYFYSPVGVTIFAMLFINYKGKFTHPWLVNDLVGRYAVGLTVVASIGSVAKLGRLIYGRCHIQEMSSI